MKKGIVQYDTILNQNSWVGYGIWDMIKKMKNEKMKEWHLRLSGIQSHDIFTDIRIYFNQTIRQGATPQLKRV